MAQKLVFVGAATLFSTMVFFFLVRGRRILQAPSSDAIAAVASRSSVYLSGKRSTSNLRDFEEESYEGFGASVNQAVHSFALELSDHLPTSRTGSPRDYNDNESPVDGNHTSRGVVPFDSSFRLQDPRLDPHSPSFSSKFWVSNLKKLMDSDPDHYRRTSLSVAFKDLRAYGRANHADYQTTVLNAPLKLIGHTWHSLVNQGDTTRDFNILKPMDGLIKRGTVTVVLGRPGAGCTTFLKTIASHTHGFKVGKESVISYDGITPKEIKENFRGEVTYSAETDVHYPHLTVGQTLNFAARLRVPQNRPSDVSREEYASHIAAVYMATFGLLHCAKTKVGNDFVRGISGGERKRVSIAEVSLCGSSLQCWDNSTRGLDSATALEFIRALKTSAEVLNVTSLIAIYQCSQDAYDLFDNCILLYEGYQIYSGPAKAAKNYFLRMGFKCPKRQTTADFLTSLTSPAERIVRPGFEKLVPRTPQQFYNHWKLSDESQTLTANVDAYLDSCRISTDSSSSSESSSEAPDTAVPDAREAFSKAHRARQSDNTSKSSPFTLSYWMQIRELVHHNWRRVKGNPKFMLGNIVIHIILSLIMSSLFYNLSATTDTFYERGSALFFGILINSLSSLLELMALFEARPVVEKHKQYALYRPSAESLASIITEMPSKIIICVCFNLVYYFMIHFKREAGPFFFYLLLNFAGTLAMSHLFRTVGAFTRTIAESMVPAYFALLAYSLYAGFASPIQTLPRWSFWINYINPIGYVFEALVANEFHGRRFPCSEFVPSGAGYETITALERACMAVGSVAGESTVSGDAYIKEAFQYSYSHRWRNFGITMGFAVFFLITYLIASELSKVSMQKGEVTLFLRQHLGKLRKAKKKREEEADEETGTLKEANGVTSANDESARAIDETVILSETARATEEARALDETTTSSSYPTSSLSSRSTPLSGRSTPLSSRSSPLSERSSGSSPRYKTKKRLENVEHAEFVEYSSASHTATSSSLSPSAASSPFSSSPSPMASSELSEFYAGKDVFHWRDVCYDVDVGSDTRRRLLDNVCGWVKPGTLTALMGASGAGKTTLLDVLANRVSTGIIYGHMFVNGRARDASFQRSTGYAQQQDLHMPTSTVREALRFSAQLRQPASVSTREKNDYVESVIRVLEMERYADAVVGVAGEGLNVEQRKRLTIGVELAAKPRLLLFLDEPTSGLDSQTAWSICQLMRKLADNGQAILCTIHQPSTLLIQVFDRLLFLARNGQTVYFGDLGKKARTLIDYFESHGAPACPKEANPVEWMLHVIGAAPGSQANQDYHDVWIRSEEYAAVRAELQDMEQNTNDMITDEDEEKEKRREFAAPFWRQYLLATKRVLECYYRSPGYIWAKIVLTVLCALFNGFTFYKADTSLQGMQNQMLSIFVYTLGINPLIDQMAPMFVAQRSLYEVKERPSKTFSWVAFIFAQITAEIPWTALMGTIGFFAWYYPIGFYKNAIPTEAVTERGALTWLYLTVFWIFSSSYGQIWIVGLENGDVGSDVSYMFFMIAFTFCGALKIPTGFWVWMYTFNPLTYFMRGVMSTTLANNEVVCSATELVIFSSPANSTCGDYLAPFLNSTKGYLVTSNTTNCQYCPYADTSSYLKTLKAEYSERWSNFGVLIAFIAFNFLLVLFFYWLLRVPKRRQSVKTAIALPSPPTEQKRRSVNHGKASAQVGTSPAALAD